MPQDFRSRAQPTKIVKKESTPAWVPFFYGFLLGSFCVGLAWYQLTPVGTPIVWPEFSKAENFEAQQMNTKKEAEPKKPRFDFYTILPEMEFVISDDEVTSPDVVNHAAPSAEPSVARYRLQVGSFKKVVDADRQKAHLALLGIEADIQKVDIGQGDIYYRVLTKSVSGKSDLNTKRRLLKKNNISSLVVQIRN